jgi:hypothetical protein
MDVFRRKSSNGVNRARQPQYDGADGLPSRKYGEPTERKSVTYQNAFGAKWECLQATWQMPDGAVILASESIKNLRGPTRWLTVSFVSKERIAQVAAEQKAKANPYK